VKAIANETLKIIGSLLLLAILVKGLAGLLLYVETAKHWLIENEDGNYDDIRLTAAFFVGLTVWIWLISKIRQSEK